MTGHTLSPILRFGAANRVKWVVQTLSILINTVVFAVSLMALTFMLAMAASGHWNVQAVLVALTVVMALVLSVLNLAAMLRPYRTALDSCRASEPCSPGARKTLLVVNMVVAVVGGAAIWAVSRAPEDLVAAPIFAASPLICAAAHRWPPSYLQPHECPRCQYDLRQAPDSVCPECGYERQA